MSKTEFALSHQMCHLIQLQQLKNTQHHYQNDKDYVASVVSPVTHGEHVLSRPIKYVI